MACARPLFTLRTLHSALRTSHFISSHLSSSHLISPHLSSSHLIPSLLRCHLSSSQLFSSHPITAQPFSSHRSSWKLISALLYVRKLLLSERSSSTQKDTNSVARRKLLHREFFRLRHRCVHTENLLAFPYGNLLHREAFADRIFYTQNLLHTEAFYTEALFFRTLYGHQLIFSLSNSCYVRIPSIEWMSTSHIHPM